MRYASPGTASLETPQANCARKNSVELPSVVTNTGKARSRSVHAKGAIFARRAQRSLRRISLETNLMTPRQDSAEYQRPVRNGPKHGRI
jgi:hypothetical protein